MAITPNKIKISHIATFDQFGCPPQVGTVSLEDDGRDDHIIVTLNGVRYTVLKASRDQWGTWLAMSHDTQQSGPLEIAEEDGTRSFIAALIDCLKLLLPSYAVENPRQRVRIRAGWAGAGRKGVVIGPPLWHGQEWAPVVWDGEEDPDFHKWIGLEPDPS